MIILRAIFLKSWKFIFVYQNVRTEIAKILFDRRFVDDAFLQTYIHTIGIDFLEKLVDLEATGQKVLLQIWDTAGQDRYRDNF